MSEAIQEKYPLPDYCYHRIQVLERIQAEQQIENEEVEIEITLPDGSKRSGIKGVTSPYDVAMEISKGLAKQTIIAKVNGDLFDAKRPLEGDCTLSLLKFTDPEAQKVYWHSSSHILGQALERFYHCNLCIGPAIKTGGFYYDMRVVDEDGNDRSISESEFQNIKEIMGDISKQAQDFERIVLTKEQALEMFQFNPYKIEIINDKVPDGETCTAYRCGPLIDLCKGPHIPNTSYMKFFDLTLSSSTNWKGKVENDPLQRLYGISFPQKKLLNQWKHNRAEAEKRDHRKLGKEQELFFFHPLSPGCAFFLPRGTHIYTKLLQFMRGEYRNRGFTEVVTPNMFNKSLWETSGHWQNYSEDMFTLDVDKTEFALKPMNCPGHCLMFQSSARSYRDLPLRFADFGVLHRNELSGALSGLTRVRRFQQDDAHIFCREDQIKDEIRNCLEFMQFVYVDIFKFEFRLDLSTRPENKYMGDLAVWDRAEDALAEELTNFAGEGGWNIKPGDGAFYGPKIDIHIKDALGREHQCATVQLDFQLPLNFKLEYQGEGEVSRPVMIHRAIYGSFERFIAILIEHTGGKWPFWISPRQVIVLSVAEQVSEYCQTVRDKIHRAGFVCDIDDSDKKLGKKIRESQLAQYNFILVVGEQEQEAGSVNIRTRDNQRHGTKPLDEFLDMIKELENNHE
eukprot:TRINITY_DN9684_c0_g1_i1.p1 TRINITY_DN9684_c0_g1~~TRINITY_DN9684_c0_g1_i1.p1  ORF type:complete len:680 (+),score=186.53 TRINITY_DN9684_c0_g1_i1:42-2081(+)